jgi:hypothetical protein
VGGGITANEQMKMRQEMNSKEYLTPKFFHPDINKLMGTSSVVWFFFLMFCAYKMKSSSDTTADKVKEATAYLESSREEYDALYARQAQRTKDKAAKEEAEAEAKAKAEASRKGEEGGAAFKGKIAQLSRFRD